MAEQSLEGKCQSICVCPKYESAFQILGKRWNGLIISVLHKKDCRFSEIARAITELSDRVLTERIRELEEQQIIEKYQDDTNCLRPQYRLTEKGKRLAEALMPIQEWADNWMN